ncbi:MAG: hypothetical protein H6719_19040 [Sandaracinaceae bacterium]|nr:hypothetical protein [Sandaracinaceae bacterium]
MATARARRKRWSWIAGAVALALTGCPDDGSTVIVDVLTNYRPGIDFDGVVVVVHEGSDTTATGAPIVTSARRSVAARPGAPMAFRGAELDGVGTGSRLVLARLLRGDAEIGRGRVLVTIAGSATSVIVLVTSECDGVTCPGAGDPELTACRAGRCVDPRCSPTSTEFCPPPECATDSECAPAGPPCVRGVCFAGACASFADDDRCEGTCDRDLGCVGELDAGAMDAGAMDAGAMDAGAMDAGFDAGFDAAVPLPPFAEVAAGNEHTCARTTTGEVWCWGRNDRGQLGDGTTTDRARPVLVPGLSGVDQLDLGHSHSCARSGSTVRCWGDNDLGQCGSGSPVVVTAPQVVGGASGATHLTAGDDHSCVLVGTEARCWGRGNGGPLGNGGSTLIVPSPSRVSEPAPIARVSAGQLHTCIVLASGQTKCTGNNFHGQLGDDTTTTSLVPVTTMIPLDVTAVTLGFGHTCAVRGPGTSVWCWGDNDEGMLGDGTFDESHVPVQVTGLAGVLSVSAGNFHNCARTASGLRCWGRNDQGQLGDGSGANQPTPVSIATPLPVVQVAGGGYHTCAVHDDGSLSCWGANGAGQLGDGTRTPRLVPTLVP